MTILLSSMMRITYTRTTFYTRFRCHKLPVYFYIGKMKENKKRWGSFLYVLVVALTIFCFTKESNEYYQLDYKRYLRDVDVAHNVNYDIEKLVGMTPEVPVLFIGQPDQVSDIPIEGEIALTSIYSNNLEGESIRIHRFFSMLGYEYPNVMGEEITIYNYSERLKHPKVKAALTYSDNMPKYPHDGYISIMDDMIIVKLGNKK